jgi:hypothetical protein
LKNIIGYLEVNQKAYLPKTPSDVILKFRDGSFQGYSNKIAAGSDETPKFNTNITAYYDKLGNGGQLNNIKKLIDNSWNQAAREVDGAKRNAKKAIQAFDITREKFSETASSEEFGRLASKFRADGLDFYGEDFYYKFRNNHIKKKKCLPKLPLYSIICINRSMIC